MSSPVRCPAVSCFASHDSGELAFDGYFACHHCATYLPKESFIRWLMDIDADLVKQRQHIQELMTRVTYEVIGEKV